MYNTFSSGLQKLVWFSATRIMCSFSLPPSSFHDPLSVSFSPLCSLFRVASLRFSCHLASRWIQPMAVTDRSLEDGKRWRCVYHPVPMLPSCLDTGVTVTVFCYDLGSHQTTFLPHLQLPSCFRNVILSSCFLRLRVGNGFPLLLFPKVLPCWFL